MMIEKGATVIRPSSRQKRSPSARVVFKGKLFCVWQWEQVLFDGTIATFEMLQRPDTVLVLPVLSNGQVILAEELQPGLQEPVVQALGGRVEEEETPEEAARRELLEESGYAVQELRLWDAWQPVAKIDWAVYLYIAHGLTRISDASLAPDENITLRTFPVTSLLDRNSKLMIGDYELLHKLYYARSNEQEHERVSKLLGISS